MKVFDTYNGHTKAYGIIGNPIEHSFSPVLQNTILSELNFNGVYIPFRVDEKDIKTAITTIKDVSLISVLINTVAAAKEDAV